VNNKAIYSISIWYGVVIFVKLSDLSGTRRENIWNTKMNDLYTNRKICNVGDRNRGINAVTHGHLHG
jgi:hypothetical protein